MFWAIDLVVISALWTAVTTALDVSIKPARDDYKQAIGTNIVFLCEVTSRGDSNVRIQWLDSTRTVITEVATNRIYVEKNEPLSRKLYITKIENVDAGRYYCVAYSGSSKQDKSVELTVYKGITFDHVPNPQHPAIHTDAVIECQVSGEPGLEVSWKYNGNSLKSGGRYSVLKNGLRIQNITLSDDGNYSCMAVAMLEGTFDKRRITVAVHIPPVVDGFHGNFEEVEGNNVTLTCTATGLPPPKFEFYKDVRGKVLSSTDRIVVDADGGKLSFQSVRKEDEGMYTCNAINDVGTNGKARELRVFVPPRIYELKNITKSEQESGTLVCRSHGDPSPVMEFHKEGNLYPYRLGNNDVGRIFVAKKSDGHLELTIRILEPSDAANYTCMSRNSAGEDNETGVIDVHYKPRFDKDHKSLVYGWAGTRHNISCHVHAQPVPTIRWIRYGRFLENNETFFIYSSGRHSNLQVRIKESDQSWIYGDYICQAENSRGREELAIQLNRATIPEAPVRVKNKDISPNQVVLLIDPPRENGGVQIIGYRVEFESIVQDVSLLGNLAVEPDDGKRIRPWFPNFTSDRNLATELSIDNLRPGTKYVFRIRAKNEVGVGSDMEHVVTTANLTNPYPIKLTSPRMSIGSSYYRVTWERPKTGGRPIREYEFRYRKVRHGLEDSKQKAEEWQVEYMDDDLSKPLLEYMLRGLTPQTDYQLQVLAKNDLGVSGPSEKFYFRTPEAGPPNCSGLSFYQLFGSCSRSIGCLTLVISTFATKWIVESAKI